MQWDGEIYLEDGLHRALRAALQNRHAMHVRIVLDLDALQPAVDLAGAAGLFSQKFAYDRIGHQPAPLRERDPAGRGGVVIGQTP